MYGKRKYPKYKKRTGRTPLRSRRVRTVKPAFKMVKSIVKKALDRRIENKEICLQGAKVNDTAMKIYQYFGATITTSSTATLIPSITQSVGENGRIGNGVKVKSAYMRACLVLNSIVLDTRQPLQPGQYQVRLFIGRLKNSIAAPTNSDYDKLLRAGATVYPFDSSDCLSICRSVNTEFWTIYYDKVHKVGTSNSLSTTSFNTTTGIPNNDYHLTKYLRIPCTKFFKKNLQFMDTTINTPTNFGLYMFAGIVDSMASGNSNVNPFVLLNYDLEISYEDA